MIPEIVLSSVCTTITIIPGVRGEGNLKRFTWEGSATRSNHLSFSCYIFAIYIAFYISFWQESDVSRTSYLLKLPTKNEYCIPFINSWNEINEQYHDRTSRREALPEEILTNKELLFVQFTLWQEKRYSDFLLCTSTCEIPFFKYTWSRRKTPFSGRASPCWSK